MSTVPPPRRLAFVLALAATMLLSLAPANAPSAAAWANNGNEFGNHDWILYQAVEAIGGAPDWLDLDIALRHSDDPDTDRALADAFLARGHVYKEQGRRGGGPSAVFQHYVLAVEAYRRGEALADQGDTSGARDEWDEASRLVGLLSHYEGDLAQPFHSAYAAEDDEALHGKYEKLVAPLLRHPDAWPQWQVQGAVSPSTDVRQTAVRTAAYSRPFYPELRSHLRAHPGELNARAKEITGLVLRRASADLASIIAAIPGGEGMGPELTVSVAIRAHKLQPTQGVMLTMRVTDPNGKGVEGVMFVARIPDPNGRSHVEHWTTDAKGDAHFYFKVKGLDRGVRYTGDVKAKIGATTVTWPQWFKVTR